jgi:hypothetical protein
MLTAAVVPVVTLPTERLFAGPGWRTNDSDCDGELPLMLTAAVVPVVTLPTERLFAGPG